MKAHALYHLIQLRARKLSEHLPSNIHNKLTEIQTSLKIKRLSGSYSLEWQLGGVNYDLILESDPFKFYEKGDSVKRNAKRSTNLNYRSENWASALQLWKDIFFRFNAIVRCSSFCLRQAVAAPK